MPKAPDMSRQWFLPLLFILSSCAHYQPEPLVTKANLATSLAALQRMVPVTDLNAKPMILPETGPLSVDQVGLLAILNDPDLAAEFGQLQQAKASMVSGTALPNPQLGFGVMALLGGPASTPSYAASLSQDITSLITYQPRAAAARAQFASANAQLLWQEWLVGQQARLLAVAIYGTTQEVEYRTQELAVLNDELAEIHKAALANNLTLSDEGPVAAAVATAESSLATARLSLQQSWQSLDALLGLQPSVRFQISQPSAVELPGDLAPLLASLPERRPDLLALKLGYQAADEQVRAAILSQFPALSLGPSYGSDTSNVRSSGPQINLALPIFDHNQGGVMAAQATRETLHAQYQAELDRSEGKVGALVADIAALQANLAHAQQAAAHANDRLASANQAYSQNNLDQRGLADYQTAAFERALDEINDQTELTSDELAIQIELGLGLPQTRITPQIDPSTAPGQR